MCGGGGRGSEKARLTLQSVVTEQETVRGEGTDARKKSDEKHRELFTETERKRTGGDGGGGRCSSRNCTVTETLLQTESVQRQGIEQCPKSIYSLNTDDTGQTAGI